MDDFGHHYLDEIRRARGTAVELYEGVHVMTVG